MTTPIQSDGYRILILSVSAGTGHVRAGQALEKAARAHPEVRDVMHLDALQFTNKVFRRFYGEFYIDLVRSAPLLLGWFFESSDEPWKTEKMRGMLERMNTGPLVRKIRQFNPDITICTHFLPAEILAHLIKRERVETRLSIVVTDYYVHAMWLSRIFHRYFVACEESKVQLENIGFPPEAITVSGIPIDPVFCLQKERGELRAAHGLRDDLPVLLVSAGALGVGSAGRIAEVLGTITLPLQVVVICGKNEKLYHTVLEQKQRLESACEHLALTVLRYTTEIDEWMKLSDLYIGKPGGLTTAEALSCGLPMVIYQPIPGQEERNSDFLLEQGAAVKCNQITTMAYKVQSLLADPGRMERMRQCALRAGRPSAAGNIIEQLIDEYHTGGTVTIAKKRRGERTRERFREMGRRLRYARDDAKPPFPV